MVAVLSTSTYLAIRAPYSAAHQAEWSQPRRHLYELWRFDVSSPARYCVLLLMLVAALYAFRRWRQAVLVRKPGPIAVAELVNATGAEMNVAELSAAFRTSLGRVDLNSPASVPGAGRPTEFLELLRGAANERSMLGTIAGLLGLTWVTHAYVVTAVLRTRENSATACGITASVATLPRGGTAPYTVWAPTWNLAVEQAALAVGAAVLPLTRLCRRPPWADWRGLALPPQLFATYLEAKDLVTQRRYDEALGKFYEALELDPLNLHIRLEIGSLEEQLQLFLDALETYDDVIALGSRADERSAHAWQDRFAAAWQRFTLDGRAVRKRSAERARHPLGEGWRGKRAGHGIRPAAWAIRSADRHGALLIARYRYAMVLGFSEVVVAQWIQGIEDAVSTRRDLERERLRSRLLPRLSRYPYEPCRRAEELESTSAGKHANMVSPSAREILSTVMPHLPTSAAEIARLVPIERTLRTTAQRAQRIAAREPRCAEHLGFIERFRVAEAFVEDQRPATALALHGAAKSLLAASALCDHKDWSEVKQVADDTLPLVRPHPPMRPTGIQVLRAQELLQQAAVAEVKQLCDDYRWWGGRRRPAHAVTQRALRVSSVAASLRLLRVQWLISGELHVAPNSLGRGARPVAEWPPPINSVSRKIGRALGRNPFTVHEWQDFYNAACVYAIPLLPANSWAGHRIGHRLAVRRGNDPSEREAAELLAHDFAAHAVRALERAIDTSDSHFAAGRRNWLAFEDPDLIGFRSREEYARFRARNLVGSSAAVPLPKNVHVLQLSAYVTELIRELALAMTDPQLGNRPIKEPSASDVASSLELDRQSWRYVLELTREHRDWRSRLAVLQHVQRLRHSVSWGDTPVAYPTYPDTRIGDLGDVSSQHDSRHLTIAGRYARQERVDQLARIERIVDGPISRQRPSEVQVVALPDRYQEELLHCRTQAWVLLRDCLGINFFTDDKSELGRRKEHARDIESRLSATVTRAASMQFPTAADRQTSVPFVRRRLHS
jgi:hypothetical protein